MGRHQLKSIPIIIASALLIAGCNDQSLTDQNEKLKKEFANLKNIQDTQSQQIDLLKSKVERLERDEDITKSIVGDLLVQGNRVASLSIGSTGYRAISHEAGDMVVSLVDVSAFASGSKIKLRFGNASAAKFSGVSAKIEYGPLAENGTLDSDKVNAKIERFSPDFYPGAWVSVEFILEKIKPENLGAIRISQLSHTSMILSSKNN